jgi:hypothetical protein
MIRSGPQVAPPSLLIFWQMSRGFVEFERLLALCSGSQPSPKVVRHSAKARRVLLSPARVMDGIRMHG